MPNSNALILRLADVKRFQDLMIEAVKEEDSFTHTEQLLKIDEVVTLLRDQGQRYRDLEAMCRDANVSRWDFEEIMQKVDHAVSNAR